MITELTKAQVEKMAEYRDKWLKVGLSTETLGLECVEKDGMFYIRVNKEKTVTHEEHNPVTIPPGVYRVRKVREYDHFAEEARAVAD